MTTKTKKKTKSKKQRKHYCPKCKDRGQKHIGVYATCPYAEDVNSQTVMCWCCSDCRYECAQDI